MKRIHDFAVVLWEWYVVRTWQYFFPPEDQDATPPEA